MAALSTREYSCNSCIRPRFLNDESQNSSSISDKRLIMSRSMLPGQVLSAHEHQEVTSPQFELAKLPFWFHQIQHQTSPEAIYSALVGKCRRSSVVSWFFGFESLS